MEHGRRFNWPAKVPRLINNNQCMGATLVYFFLSFDSWFKKEGGRGSQLFQVDDRVLYT
jgi:hypothetical protein